MIDIAKALAQYDADAKLARDAFIDNLRELLNQVLPCPRIEIISYKYAIKDSNEQLKLHQLWIGGEVEGWKVIFVGQDKIRKLINSNNEPFNSEQEAQTFVDTYQAMVKQTTGQPPCPVFVRGYCPEENE